MLKYILAAVGVILIGLGIYKLWKSESPESKERIVATIQRTDAYQEVLSQLEALFNTMKSELCVLDSKTGEVFAYAGPDIEKLVCIISADGKSIKSKVTPKRRIP